MGNGYRPYRALHVAGDTTNRRRQKALQACSLVCRSWVYPSRRNLFRHLRIQGLTKLSRFKVLFPQHAQDVLHLEFYFTSYKVKQIFIDVSHTFSALRKLTFGLMSLGTIPVEVLRRFRFISHVEFTMVTFDSIICLTQFLSNLPSLTTLRLSDIRVRGLVNYGPHKSDDVLNDAFSHTSLPQLRSIEIIHDFGAENRRPLYCLICHLPFQPNLKRLQYSCPTDFRRACPEIGLALHDKGSSLHELKVAAYFTTSSTFCMYLVSAVWCSQLTLVRPRIGKLSISANCRDPPRHYL